MWASIMRYSRARASIQARHPQVFLFARPTTFLRRRSRARNIMYTPEGGSLTLTVIADIMLIVISVIAGYVSFRRMDILKKSDWRV